MDENLEWRIRAFFDFWRKKHAFISKLDLSEQRYEANVLLWGSFDALSNLWAKEIGKNECGNSGKRIIFDGFLARYGGDVFQLVSLPDVWSRADRGDASKLPKNVCLFLSEIKRHKNNSNIYKYEDDFGMDARTIRSTSDDLNIDDVAHQVITNYPNANRAEIEQWLILSRYGAIAYKEFRNAYIHEGQAGKGAHDYQLSGWKERPTYSSWLYSTPPIMGFSVEFMLGILKQCIEKFESEALTLQVDPVPPRQ